MCLQNFAELHERKHGLPVEQRDIEDRVVQGVDQRGKFAPLILRRLLKEAPFLQVAPYHLSEREVRSFEIFTCRQEGGFAPVDIAMKFVRHELKILRQLFTENVGYTPALYNCDIRTVTMHLEEKRVFFRQVEAEAALIAKLRCADNLASNNRCEQIDAITTGPLERGGK